MQTAHDHIYEFGAFELDTAERLLRRLDGTPVPLTPRVFKTLLYMVEHHNTVLDKERIMEAVWPDSIVEENNLAQAISKLRHVFGETPGSQNYIVTVSGRGYRFVAEVNERSDNGIASMNDQATTPTPPEKRTESATAKDRQRLPGKTGRALAFAVLGVIVLSAAFVARGPTVRWLEKHRGGSAAPATSSGTLTERVRSIAVLPFEPLGQDMNNELLGLGMADAVIGRMSNLKQLVVLPTSAVSKYKGPANDPLAAGRALGVDAILSGTVQRSSDRVRATVQLVHVASGRTVWSEKFDQTFTDIFGIQDSISDNVVRSLALNLTSDERKQLGKRYTTNAAAYEFYLMGLYFWNKRSKEGLEKAIDYFGRAVEQDPNFALAYALMADCYYLQFYYSYESGPDRIRNAKAAVEQALLLDDSIAEGHVAAAMVQFYQARHEGVGESAYQTAMNSLRRALALNPNLAIAQQRYALALAALGHLDDSIREMRRARELDPLSHTNNTALGMILVFAREFRGSLEYCYKAAELAPNEALIQENLATAYAVNGMYQQAIKHYQKVGELNPDKKGDSLACVATVLVSAGRKSEADTMMPAILKLAGEGKADPYNIAVLYGQRGEKDDAFEWFDKALQRNRDRRSIGNDSRMIRYDPLLDPLRSDSRFAVLLRQHNQAWLLEAPNGPSRSDPPRP
jgi:TolB-like protein/DNA-binding winged helix-turn-helix (wHTH) protein/tetratricopeptide (TPR) repeat protein